MSEALLKRDYEICGEVGRGRYGIVYLCKSLNPSACQQQFFAVKSIDKESISGDELDSRCLLMEPKTLFLLSSHPNIIRIYNVYDDPSHLHMVLDLCNSSDLHQIIAEIAPIPEPQAARIFVQLMRAVAHCHRVGVAHRDIKPDNVLFDSSNRLKLADFGSAELFLETGPMTGVVGTPYYMAPEVISGRSYTEKIDVWSAGVVLYTMLVKLYPFRGDSMEEIFETVVRANLRFPVRYFHSVSSEAKDLLRRMVCKDVSRRFSAEQVLRKCLENEILPKHIYLLLMRELLRLGPGHPWVTAAEAAALGSV